MMQQATTMVRHIIKQIDIYGNKVAGMTGNAAAGIAVGVYHNGNLVAFSTTADELGDPIQEILLRKDRFYQGWNRWDGSRQEKTEHGGPFNERFYANRKAVSILRNINPSKRRGWSFAVVAGAPYSKFIEERGGNLISDFYAELRQLGASVSFHETR